ncbi:hypothetical protein C8A01DRAFT_31629 [Parachaetomium inaequale]|uniref:non-specific serine/threonine protein kinase n=1 Tax=Parachaetomium inaequale TaxID=2588326 RepID=A0AAN6PNZ3_9PEZI|nr:hypothetical protein C8A01DRAFT_31629 [Parachaetomium inaequale]
MSTLNLPKSAYSLYKPLDDGLFLVRRTTDGEILLARPLDADYDKTAHLIRHGAAVPAANLLNHENLVSIHDELVNIPFYHHQGSSPDSATRMFLWDFSDGGTLQDVLDDYAPPANGGGFDPAAMGGLLPEAFVWHVALGLLRGLQWLHEGVRDTYGVVASDATGRRCRRVRGQTEAEAGWMPVLHRDLRAANVFLQRPRGIETYGDVKLGGFERCFVSGTAGKGREAPVVAMEKEDGVSLGVLRKRMARWKREGYGVPKAQRPYTRGSELFAVGALLYRMMCGRELPPAEECPDCGCVHITSNDAARHNPCRHDCVKDINIDIVFAPLLNYTAELKLLVMLLLRLNRNDEWTASAVLDHAWPGFQVWATHTEDGRLYRDIFDDMWFRKQNQARFKKRRREVVEAEEEEEEQWDDMELGDDVLVV